MPTPMNTLQHASCEALSFFLQSAELKAEGKSILIIQGYPGAYLKCFSTSQIEAINYDAAQEKVWHLAKIPTNSLTQASYDIVIQFAAKSENETKLSLFKGLTYLKPDGRFIGIAHNKMGSSRYHKHLTQTFSNVESTSKAKCKVYLAQAEKLISMPDYSDLEIPKKIGNSDYYTLPGVYGEKSIDRGSVILAEHLSKESWSGMGADIGCGCGFLSGEILKTNHRVKHINLYDSDSRALRMADMNLKDKTDYTTHWTDIKESIPSKRNVHWAVMNPPFHTGISQDFELGKTFIAQAASILNPGSPLFMVANLHLPYEETLFTHFRSVVKLEERDGYKTWKALK